MTSPKGMDELFWGKDLEDVFDWVERLQMQQRCENMMRRSCLKLLGLTYTIKRKTGIED